MSAKIQLSRIQFIDERGHEHAPCGVCGVDCSTHPDAGNPLDFCGDCGVVTCPDHREDNSAARCPACAALFAAEQDEPCPSEDEQS